MDAALESRIAEASMASLCNLKALANFGQVTNELTGINIVHDRATRNDDVEIITRSPGPVPARARLAITGTVTPGHPKIR
jgi:hypothetical protein